MSLLLEFSKRVYRDWEHVADCFGISPLERAGFKAGREPQELVQWLKDRQRLSELPQALTWIGREDLLDLAQQILDPKPLQRQIVKLSKMLKRKVHRTNDVLLQRKNLSAELMNTCRQWASLLAKTFESAIQKWESGNRNAALKEIEELENDFLKLNYDSMESKSPILIFLAEDDRFKDFVQSCAQFYNSALNVKRLVHGSIKSDDGSWKTAEDIGLRDVTSLWHNQVKESLRDVRLKYMQIQTITVTQ